MQVVERILLFGIVDYGETSHCALPKTDYNDIVQLLDIVFTVHCLIASALKRNNCINCLLVVAFYCILPIPYTLSVYYNKINTNPKSTVVGCCSWNFVSLAISNLYFTNP